MRGRIDPRWLQIGSQVLLLLYGLLALDFEVAPGRTAAILATALVTQAICCRLYGKAFDPLSPLITALSLSLLIRSDNVEWVVLAAILAIASKFAIRWRGKHLFNPSCLAIVVLLALSDEVWVSSGQWGSAAIFGLACAGLGTLVLHRTARSDVTWAFLGFYASLLCGRALWLGDPLEIPLHQLQNGALVLFAFFMISDPKTLPDSRAGRILYAGLVALGAVFVQFGLFRSNGLLWSLAAAAPLVPIIDRLLPGVRYRWSSAPLAATRSLRKENPMFRFTRQATLVAAASTRRAALIAALAVGVFLHSDAQAFCGFYVAKADTKLFNKASQVVLVRDGDRTVITMSNDFQGNPTEFAMVIPVPTFIEREQIHVGDRAVIDHLDAYTSPRLVEYFDPDPCARPEMLYERDAWAATALKSMGNAAQSRARATGVTIEASYTVGEYDILILSAEQSDGLARWLRDSGYRLPDGAERILASYLKQGMHFFVAKVNLAEQSKLGFSYLRPLQVAYESSKFMLPIRLGTLNADGAQELFIYTLTRKGRVETTNYRTMKLPTGMDVPVFVKHEFGDFYKSLFDEQVRRESMRTVFTEYAWDMNWCDPCAADPLSQDELRSLGVFWTHDRDARRRGRGGKSLARDVYVTRLHVRYDEVSFPADLVFQETSDRSNFQGRYVLRHPFDGPLSCSAGDDYRRQVRDRQDREAQTLASLTGWSLSEIRRKIGGAWTSGPSSSRPWWERIWTN